MHNVVGLATKQLHSTGVETVVPPPQPDVSAWTVLVMTVLMAGAAGLGALPFFFIRSLSPALGALATATACGVMFAASFDLIHEGIVMVLLFWARAFLLGMINVLVSH